MQPIEREIMGYSESQKKEVCMISLPMPSDPAASGLPPPLPLLQSSLLFPFVDMSETTGTVINKPGGKSNNQEK
jgi:hypothetical protein